MQDKFAAKTEARRLYDSMAWHGIAWEGWCRGGDWPMKGEVFLRNSHSWMHPRQNITTKRSPCRV